MNLSPVVLAIPIYFVLMGIEIIYERITNQKYYRLNDAISNINCGITSQVTGIFLKVLSIGLYELLYSSFHFYTIPFTWWSVALAFVAYDFCYYWAHRMSHEVNLFWGGHSVHHQSEDYNLSVALRQSATQTIWTFPFYLPMALLGFDTWTFIWASGLNLIYQFWIHTEAVDKMGWWEKILNTPSHHRVHHGKDPKYIDKNHAGAFIVWDKLFGTFKEEEERPTYGVTKPLNNWNPVWANIEHYRNVLRDASQAKGLDKVRVLFNKPGWRPDYLGGPLYPNEIEKESYRKYDPAYSSWISVYALVHYLLLLLGTALFLFNQKNFDMPLLILFTMAIVHATVNLSSIFEQRRWVWASEIFRMLYTPFIFVLLPSTLPFWLHLTIALVCFSSIVYLSAKRNTYILDAEQT